MRIQIKIASWAENLNLMSAEPTKKKPYSTDLRWRIIYQRLGMELPFHKIAKNLNIAISTAHRIFKGF